MTADDKTWFCKQVLGHNLLGSMMERLSEQARLSTRYTNHCVRATAVTVLKSAGVEDRTVCLVTGHKNERSLARYSKPSTVECKELSSVLDERRTPSTSGTAAMSRTCSSKEIPKTDNNKLTETANGSCKIVAPGAVFNNLSITIGGELASTGTQGKRKRLSLSTKAASRKRENHDGFCLEAASSASMSFWTVLLACLLEMLI